MSSFQQHQQEQQQRREQQQQAARKRAAPGPGSNTQQDEGDVDEGGLGDASGQDVPAGGEDLQHAKRQRSSQQNLRTGHPSAGASAAGARSRARQQAAAGDDDEWGLDMGGWEATPDEDEVEEETVAVQAPDVHRVAAVVQGWRPSRSAAAAAAPRQQQQQQVATNAGQLQQGDAWVSKRARAEQPLDQPAGAQGDWQW